MAAGDLREYDPAQIAVSVAGITLKGWADGEMVRIEQDNPAFEDVVGTDGEVTRARTSDWRATATIRLMQSSPSNDLLSALHILDKNTPGGVGVGAFSLRDKNGTTLILAEKCWISKGPDGSWDRTPTEREWIVRIAKLVAHYGGNTEASAE